MAPPYGNSPTHLSTSIHTPNELLITSVREQHPSLPPDKQPLVHSSADDGDMRSSREGSHTPLSIGSRSSSSLTDVSTCSKDSSVMEGEEGEGDGGESEATSRQLTTTDSPSLSPTDQRQEEGERGSDHHSPSTTDSEGSVEQALEKERVDQLEGTKEPSTSDHLPPLSTSLSHHNAATTVPVVTVTTTTAHPPPLFTQSSNLQTPPTTQEDHTPSTSQTPPTTLQDSTPSSHMYTWHSPSTSTVRVPPPSLKLPNFFMSPQQLEESMRLLRAGALSRPPPKTRSDFPPSSMAPPLPLPSCQRGPTANHLKTLQEVRAYLESRRTAEGGAGGRPQGHEMSAAETKRLARIFSS